jgi:hypothetical protein
MRGKQENTLGAKGEQYCAKELFNTNPNSLSLLAQFKVFNFQVRVSSSSPSLSLCKELKISDLKNPRSIWRKTNNQTYLQHKQSYLEH